MIITFIDVSIFTPELRVRSVLLNIFKPSSDFYSPFQGGAFVDRFCYLCFTFVFIIQSLQPCDHLLGLLCALFPCVIVTFPYGVLGQLWYLIISIPDICFFFTFVYILI